MRELKNMDCLSYFLTFLLLVAVFNVAKGQPLVTALFIFGDSVVDAGNNNNLYTIVKANFPPYGRDFNDHKPTGRFCNGKLASDYTAESLGFNSYPPAYLNSVAKGSNLFNGANFASAASGYYDPTTKLYVRKGCCGTGLLEASILCNQKSIETCANASEYVFWDGVHLSQDFFEARKGCCGTVLLEASILCNQKSIRNSSGNIRSLSSTTLFPQSIRTSTPKSQSHRVSSAPASFDMKESLLRNNNGTNFDVGNGINRNMVKGREEDERQYSAKLSEVDIYESSRYDALLLKEDLKNTNWLHSGDDKCDQGPIFDNGFEHLPEPFGLL